LAAAAEILYERGVREVPVEVISLEKWYVEERIR